MTRIGITGHQNVPQAAAELLKLRLNQLLPEVEQPLEALSSLAAGADQLFVQHVLSLGGRLIAIIPSAGYEATFKNPVDKQEYLRLKSMANRVETLPFDLPTEEAFYAAGRRIAEEADWLVAVWDGAPSRGLGGTADVVKYANQLNKRVEVVWPDGLVR